MEKTGEVIQYSHVIRKVFNVVYILCFLGFTLSLLTLLTSNYTEALKNLIGFSLFISSGVFFFIGGFERITVYSGILSPREGFSRILLGCNPNYFFERYLFGPLPFKMGENWQKSFHIFVGISQIIFGLFSVLISFIHFFFLISEY